MGGNSRGGQGLGLWCGVPGPEKDRTADGLDRIHLVADHAPVRPGRQRHQFRSAFPAKYDRRHDLSIVASYEFSKKFDVSATFVYGTGLCGSLALQTICVPQGYNFTAGSFTQPYPVDYLESRNNYRLPSYQRLDLGMNFHRFFRSGRHRTLNVSVYNVYNRNNPFLVYRDGQSLKQLSIFPIMPSVSYTFFF